MISVIRCVSLPWRSIDLFRFFSKLFPWTLNKVIVQILPRVPPLYLQSQQRTTCHIPMTGYSVADQLEYRKILLVTFAILVLFSDSRAAITISTRRIVVPEKNEEYCPGNGI